MIVNRALVREVLQTSAAVTFVILSIFVVVRSLGFLQQAVRGDVPAVGLWWVHAICLFIASVFPYRRQKNLSPLPVLRFRIPWFRSCTA